MALSTTQTKKTTASQLVICFLLSAIMLVCLLPVSVFAAKPDNTAEDTFVYSLEPEAFESEGGALPAEEDKVAEPPVVYHRAGVFYQSIVPFTTPCCAIPNITHDGNMGDIAAADSPTNAIITGALWEFCAACNTITIGGGGLQMPDNTNNLTQSRFPAAIRPLVELVVFTDPIIAGTSIQCLFHGLTNLTEINNIDYIDVTLTRNFRRAFMATQSLIAPVDLSMWNTPLATNMYRMFHLSGVVSLNLGGSFNSGGLVTDFGSMFWGANDLTTIGDVSNWNMGSATRFHRMFQDTFSLADFDPSNWNVTNNLHSMYQAFAGVGRDAAPVTQNWDLSGWDVSGVTTMSNAFRYMTNLESINVSGWNTINVIAMNSIFNNTQSLTRLDLGSWNLTNLDGVANNNFNVGFTNTALRELVLGSNWVTVANPNLPAVPDNAEFYGQWVRVGAGTVNNPLGGPIPGLTSAQLMNNAIRPNPPSGETYTWVWRPRAPQWEVRFIPNYTTRGSVAPTTPALIPVGSPNNTLNLFDPLLPVITITPSPNYEFSHWISNRHSGSFVTTSAIRDLPIGDNTIFTAVFTHITHNVVFNLNGGNAGGNQASITHTLSQGDAVANVPVPSRPGSYFEGWQEDGAGPILSSAQVAALIVTGPRTFVAVWMPQSGGGTSAGASNGAAGSDNDSTGSPGNFIGRPSDTLNPAIGFPNNEEGSDINFNPPTGGITPPGSRDTGSAVDVSGIAGLIAFAAAALGWKKIKNASKRDGLKGESWLAVVFSKQTKHSINIIDMVCFLF